MIVVFFAYVVVALLAFAQMIRIQYFSDYADRYTGIIFREVDVPAYRGSIMAHDGRVLASTVPYYELRLDTAVPSDSLFEADVRGLSVKLSALFGDKSAAAYEKYIREARRDKKSGYRNLRLGDRIVSYDELQQVKTYPLVGHSRYTGGLIATAKDKRVFPYGRLAFRTIGYIAEDEQAGVGIEYAYNSYLKGHPGTQIMHRTSGTDHWTPIDNDPVVAPQDGYDVVSTLDIDIQEAAEVAMRNQLVKNDNIEGATAVVMEVQTGAIRAIVNMKKKADGTYDETFNYAISEATNPGSTFKLATLICLLEDGYVTLSDSVHTGHGGWRYFGHTFTESSGSYGTISVQQALEKSSNVAFAKMAVEYYGEQEKKYINRLYNMKLNERLNIELIGEGAAAIPFPGDAGWSKLSLPMIAMGYEMKLTPLHTLTLYNAVANDGRIVAPYFIEKLMQHGRVVETFSHPPLSNAICTPNTLRDVRTALRGVMEHGTGRYFNDTRYAIAGKTGTAQIAFDGKFRDAEGNRKYQASFVGFFPAEAPKYSMIVVMYSGKTRANFYGATWAGPVFKTVADHIYVTHPFWNAPVALSESTQPNQ